MTKTINGTLIQDTGCKISWDVKFRMEGFLFLRILEDRGYSRLREYRTCEHVRFREFCVALRVVIDRYLPRNN